MYALGTDLARARLNWPTLRRLFLPQLRPFDTVSVPPDDPAIIWYNGMGPTVQGSEELAFEAFHSNVGAQDIFALFTVATEVMPATPGPIYTARATASITSVDSVWTNGSITFDETLPAGMYEVVGLEAVEGTTIAVRLVFPTQLDRPGVVCTQSVADRPSDKFRMGRLGSFGRFVNTALPTLDILCNDAAAHTPELFIDLVKVG